MSKHTSPVRKMQDEQYDLLKYRIANLLNGRIAGPTTIVFTSYARGEGVSTVAANFALSMSADQKKSLLLVDCNLQEPSLHRMFKTNGHANGKTTNGTHDLAERTREILSVRPNLDVLLNREPPETKLPAIRMGEFSTFLQEAKKKYDFVILDCPSLKACSYSALLASKADGVVMVVEAERVRRQVLQRAIVLLEEMDANILGVVLNKRKYPIPRFIYRMI